MSETAINGKPEKAVTNLSITRDENVFTVSWKTPSILTDSSNDRRIEAFDVYWYLANPQCYYYRGGDASKFPPTGNISSKFIDAPDYLLSHVEWISTSSTSDSYSINLDPRQLIRGTTAKNVMTEAGSKGVSSLNYSDKSEINAGQNLANQSSITGVVVVVKPWNRKGFGPSASGVFTLYAPKTPTLSTPSLNSETGNLSTTVTLPSLENDHYPAMYTSGYLSRIDNYDETYKEEVTIKTFSGSSSSERVFDYDLPEWQALSYNQWIKLTFYANTYGIGRATKYLSVNQKFTTYSDYFSKYASVSHIFAYPAQAVITAIDYSHLNFDPTGRVIVHLDTNKSTYHPVDSIKLMILKNSTAEDASSAAYASGWTYVDGAVDNGNCVGFVDTMVNAVPDVGRHTWYRLETKHDSLLRYSVAVEAKMLFRSSPVASDEAVVIQSITPNSDGTSVEMLVGWDSDNLTGTEISWAEKSTAWESTSTPQTFNITWYTIDAEETVVPGKNRYARISIEGLREGTPYYFRARRYLTEDSGTTYGPYASFEEDGKLKTVAPVSKPYSVTVSIPEYTVKGKSLIVSWAYEANARQTGWQVYFVRKENDVTISKLMASGEDAITYKVISGPVISEYAGSDAEIYVRVSITTGGDWANSLNAKTRLVTAPALKLQAPDTLISTPYVFSVYTDQQEADVICKIKSCGNERYKPDGTIVETPDETVWSENVSFAGYTDDGAATGKAISVSTGSGFDFSDGARYYIEAQAVNRSTGLTSSAKRIYFRVRWAHQAIAPKKETSYVTPDNYDGGSTVTIFPGRPYGESIYDVNAYGDVCDIYRVTSEGVYRIAEGIPFDQPVTDIYAPYNKNGNLRYIIATRTLEGDLNWISVPYFLRNMNLMFDWGDGEHLEVPYNLDTSDEYSKSFTSYASLGGGYSGTWNASVKHKTKVSTDIFKLDNAYQIEQVKKLAKYSGPIFVRTPDGQAFTANVEVDDLQRTQEKPVMAVSFNCEEIDMADEFKIQ